MEEYRSRRLQKEATKEKEKCDRESKRLLEEEQRQQRESDEVKKVEQARLHEIKIRQAEIARIKHEQEQLHLEQERVQKEQEANAELLTSQARQTPWRSAAILHAMTNTVRSWTTMMMCLPPWTARSGRAGVNTFASKATCVDCRLPTAWMKRLGSCRGLQ